MRRIGLYLLTASKWRLIKCQRISRHIFKPPQFTNILSQSICEPSSAFFFLCQLFMRVLTICPWMWPKREVLVWQCGWHDSLEHLLAQLIWPSGSAWTGPQMYHFYLTMESCWACPTLWLGRSDKSYVIMGSAGHMVTLLHIVRCSILTRVQQLARS